MTAHNLSSGLGVNGMPSDTYIDTSAADAFNEYVHSENLPASYDSMMNGINGVNMESPFVDSVLATMHLAGAQFPMAPPPLPQQFVQGQNVLDAVEPFVPQEQPQANGDSVSNAATVDGASSVHGPLTPVDDSATNDSVSHGSEDSQDANYEAMVQLAAGGTRRAEDRESRGGEQAATQRERRTISWTPETRFELLLQVAYERRHESVSEGAWHRIADGSRGGLWKGASWNGVRLEFSRLMSERFGDYASADNARARRAQLDAVALAQRDGQPSTVIPELVHPLLTDADFEPAPRRRRAAAEPAEGDDQGTENRGRGRARTSSAPRTTRGRGRGRAARTPRTPRTRRTRANRATPTGDTDVENIEMPDADISNAESPVATAEAA
ncbi:uncharacterized protein ACHE_11849S [Aspergillus chevalieri]|uniref:Uncharacterized protein n=1 Tax=Aspergillus chevalieri TaxID=182096 RepID=A0A7R7VGR0_ASPCH|nr:uncharacterized protein ACHE_11849S [Aspergillus chevalieri]BCR84447.1 hypothetical protein ACHE_11849S [Aspergillus chevalieri]